MASLLESKFLSSNNEPVGGPESKKSKTTSSTELASRERLLKSQETGAGTITADQPMEYTDATNPKNLSVAEMQDFNNYVDWLAKEKNLRGDKSLDTNNLGPKLLNEYIKKHPGTSLTGSKEQMMKIQNGLIQSMKWVYDEVSAGRAAMSEGSKQSLLLTGLSKPDGYPGQWTTTRKFPGGKWSLKDEKGNVVEMSGSNVPRPISMETGEGKQYIQNLDKQTEKKYIDRLNKSTLQNAKQKIQTGQ